MISRTDGARMTLKDPLPVKNLHSEWARQRRAARVSDEMHERSKHRRLERAHTAPILGINVTGGDGDLWNAKKNR
jgi:hypothetical protein